MVDVFSPFDYQRYEELPVEQLANFKPVENGFVRASVVEDTPETQTEAFIANNEIHLTDSIRDMQTEIMGKLALLEGESTVLTPMDKESQLMLEIEAARERDTQQGLALAESQIVHTLRDHRVTEQIDRKFVEEAIEFFSQHPPDIIFEKNTMEEFVDVAVEELNIRAREAEHARQRETSVPVMLNGEKKLDIVSDGEAAWFRLAPEVEQKLGIVRLGPDAVTKLLGAEFDDATYADIAEALLNLPGEAAKVFKRYETSVNAWAYAQEKGIGSALLPRREDAAHRVINFFTKDKPEQSPFIRIPLNAIFTTVIRRHASLDAVKTPQPFVN